MTSESTEHIFYGGTSRSMMGSSFIQGSFPSYSRAIHEPT